MHTDESTGPDQWLRWLNERAGMISASHLGDVLAKEGTKRREKYILKLRKERFTGEAELEDYCTNRYMEAGRNLELNAAGFYSLGHDEEISYHGCENPKFTICEELPFFGASLDLEVGELGIGEIKIVFAKPRFDQYVARGFPGSTRGGGVFHQANGQLLATKREWVDLIAHCPSMEYPHNIYVQRVERDEEEIQRLREAIIAFNEEIEK